MKLHFIFIQILLVGIVSINAQNASSYFPEIDGFKWKYETYNLDENQNRVQNSKRIRIDSLVGTGNFFDRISELILSKTAPEGEVQNTVFRDSSYLSFNGSIASLYFNLLSLLDSAELGGVSLSDLSHRYSGWYDLFRFAEPVNSKYELFEIDTVVNYEGIDVNVIGSISGVRSDDEIVNTPAGNFLCKKFVLSIDVDAKIQILPPPIPPLVLPIIEIPQTFYMAEGNWVVKEYRPTVGSEDLSLLGIESFTVFGAETNLIETEEPTSVYDEFIPLSFELKQNYPNPFNPSTVISYQLSENSKVSLIVYDVLGREVAVLLNEFKQAGNYQVEFNAEGLSSGIYYYRLEAGNYNQTKKMNLLK